MSNDKKEESKLYQTPGGDKYWKNRAGNWHRLDGPAIEYASGKKYWFKNGKYHRIDGPAIEIGDASFYYINGVPFKDKDAFFDALTDEEKEIALFSESFHNA